MTDFLAIMKRIYKILILLFVVILPALYLYYENRETIKSNEKQKREAFTVLRESARCPEELLKIEETQPFRLGGTTEKSYTLQQLKHSKVQVNPLLAMSFESDKKQEERNRITFRGDVIRLRSKSYITLFNKTCHFYKTGCMFRIRVSGRGRIKPYIYNLGNFETGRKDREYHVSPCRVSSLFRKDYYFVFPNKQCHGGFSVGIEMRGDLNIEGITLYCAGDSREDKIGVVTGKILEASEIPDPAKSPYPDCLYALKMKVLNFEKIPLPYEIILIAPAFKNRKRSPESYWKKGDIIRLSMIRFQDEPEAVRQIQQADTLDDFLSERYSLLYTVNPEIVKNPNSSVSNVAFDAAGKKYVSGYDRPQNPPLTEAEKAGRTARIAAELVKMKRIMGSMPASPEDLNRQFESIWAKNREKYQHTDGVYWCKQGKSYFALVKSHPLIIKKDMSKVFQSVKELSDYLLVHGVSMIVVICPHLYDISARLMNPEIAKLPDYNAAGIAKQLLERGVETLYISDEILAHAHDYELLFYYPGDPHPASGVQQVAARTTAGYLRKAFPEICQAQYRHEQFTEKLESYNVDETILKMNSKLWNAWFPQGLPVCRQHLLDGKPILSVSDSPILLYGNSFLYMPEKLPRHSLASRLTWELKTGVSVLQRAWLHPLTTMSLELLQEPERFLKGRKVCVFYYGVTHFQQSKIWNIRELDRMNRMNVGTKKAGECE